MKWELDDTTSDGIRFLLIGAGSLLLLRLGYVGLQHWMAPAPGDALATASLPFRQGYLLRGPALVGGTSGVGVRLALALTLSVACALLCAAVLHVLARLAGRSASTWSTSGLRVSLALAFCWWIAAALLIPPHVARFDAEGLHITQRPAVLDLLSLPWSAATRTLPWSAVEAIEVSPSEDGTTVEAMTEDGPWTLGSATPVDAEELAGLLRERYLMH